MNEDVTARATGATPIGLTADEELDAIREMILHEAKFFNLSGRVAAHRIVRLLNQREFDRFVNKPRGLSAAEAPCAEGVTTESETP